MHLSLSKVEIQYAQRITPTVKAVSLSLAKGQVGVLIGPSGCGKTTLLRAIAGLERISAGKIVLSGEEISSESTHRLPEHRRMGMVFQDYALFPHLNVEKNVTFGLSHFTAAQRQSRLLEVLRLVGLSDHAQAYPHELSGGQQQRVALARALAPKPAILLLDEPFSNLDVTLRERLAFDVHRILKEAGVTALMVTHDQMEAFALGDVIGVMSDGELHQWADPYTLYHQPTTRFVAEFMGGGMLLKATVRNENGHCRLQTAMGDVEPHVSESTWMRQGLESVEVLLRMHDVIHDAHASIQGTIVSRRFQGGHYLCEVVLDSQERLQVQVAHEHHPTIGSAIGVRLREGAFHVFG